MNRFIGFFLYGFAILMYLLSAITFFSYLYAFTIQDTVSAIESAFGTLVILVFMLVLAKFSLAAGKTRLHPDPAAGDQATPMPGEKPGE